MMTQKEEMTGKSGARSSIGTGVGRASVIVGTGAGEGETHGAAEEAGPGEDGGALELL